MNMHLGRIRWIGAVLALFLLLSGCRFLQTTEIGETRTETQTVELGGANEASVRIEIPAGKLTVTGGADSLAQADFRYNAADWEPSVDYSVNGSRGSLRVNQPGNDFPVGGELINEWDLRLIDTVPLDLSIETGAGEADLDLKDLDLSGLQIEMGAGKVTVDLSGMQDHDLSATISGGVGELSVILPTEMGVQVDMDTGLTSLTSSGLTRNGDYYVNEAFGEAAHTLFLNISAGLGGVDLSLAD